MAKKQNKQLVVVTFGENKLMVDKEVAKRAMMTMIEESRPAKAIKREVKLSDKFVKDVHAKISSLGKDLRIVQKELNRLQNLYETKMTPDDDAWVDKQTLRLDAIFQAHSDMIDEISD